MPSSSRPTTPESPLTNSLHIATSTMDELTAALANFSRVPSGSSPDQPSLVTCCCEREECENLASWMSVKAQLESRLILSAEVGQALLQRHEAYVRQHEKRLKRQRSRNALAPNESDRPTEENDNVLSDLIREKAMLEKRFNQALVNNEVTEISNKTILQELQDARATITRLTAHHARSVGWDARLSAAVKAKEDMQQERDGESQRARLAESQFAALKEKSAKLQAEVRRLQKDLEEKRMHRLESSESILQDARARLEELHKSVGQSAQVEQDEFSQVVEALVSDNEILKHDNAELQTLLTESREDLNGLQEELEERRAHTCSVDRSARRLSYMKHSHTGSVPLNIITTSPIHQFARRSSSAERSLHPNREPLTPETSRRFYSPSSATTPVDSHWSPMRGRISPEHISFSIQTDGDDEDLSASRPKGRKTLLLLTRDRGVQTDHIDGVRTPTPLPSYVSSGSPHEPHSEVSSYSESVSTAMSILLDRATSLLTRMTQADPLTLTNRLKRQHLKGADVGHLSRSTVTNITNDATGLRTQFRALLEDEKVQINCSRKDLRVLLKFFKDVFVEMGQLRITLNSVILDPATAPRVSEMALDPARWEKEKEEKDRQKQAGIANTTAAWIAPISRLFSGPAARNGENSTNTATLRQTVGGGPPRLTPRFVPKLGPALSAYATTVNVEFSGIGVGRSVTNTVSASNPPEGTSATNAVPPSKDSVSGLMDIFAGAPRGVEPTDPWVVLPRIPRETTLPAVTNTLEPPTIATIGRSFAKNREAPKRLSRNVDAVIDAANSLQGTEEEEPDYLAPLLQRTLRRRGLSDSSIHSTFTQHETDAHSPTTAGFVTDVSSTPSTGNLWPDRRGTMFQALSRTMQNFGISSSSDPITVAHPQRPKPPASVARSNPPRLHSDQVRAMTPGLGKLIPDLSSWAAQGSILNPGVTDSFVVGSLREESALHRTRDGLSPEYY